MSLAIALVVLVAVISVGIADQGGGLVEFATFGVGVLVGVVVGFLMATLKRRVPLVVWAIVAIVPTFGLLIPRSPASIGYFLGFLVVYGLVRGPRP